MLIASMAIVLAVCMGYTTLAVGHLDMITVTFAIMILGLGIDLGIQFVARYTEELSRVFHSRMRSGSPSSIPVRALSQRASPTPPRFSRWA